MFTNNNNNNNNNNFILCTKIQKCTTKYAHFRVRANNCETLVGAVTVLGDEFWPSLLAKFAVAYKRSDSIPKHYHIAIRHNNTDPGMLTIYANNPGGNLVHKHKTLKFDAVAERPATKYIQISWTDLEEYKNCIASNHSPYFLKLPKRNGASHSIFSTEFPVWHVNGKYP